MKFVMSKLENVIAKVIMAIDNVTNVNQAFIAILIALVSIHILCVLSKSKASIHMRYLT